MKRIIFLGLVFIGTLGVTQETKGNVIDLEITDIDSDAGNMMIALYSSERNWLKIPHEAMKGEIKNGTCKVRFENVPDGVYAISSYHDKNDNDNLDTNFLGIPKESTVSSNNAPARFGPPSWEDAKFRIKSESIKQTLKLKSP